MTTERCRFRIRAQETRANEIICLCSIARLKSELQFTACGVATEAQFALEQVMITALSWRRIAKLSESRTTLRSRHFDKLKPLPWETGGEP